MPYRGIDHLEALPLVFRAGNSLHLHQDGSALDADPLGRHADPRVAGPHDLFVDARQSGFASRRH